MKVLITGGAGFISSHVADSLLTQGHEVLVFDNFVTGNLSNLSNNSHLHVVKGSIANAKLTEKVFLDFRPDAVLHAAASFKNPYDFKKDIETNIQGTVNVARISKEMNCRQFIYLQTSLCYGLTSMDHPVSAMAPYFGGTYHGGSSYAISKTAGELYLQLTDISFLSFRLANIYGPRNLSGPIPAFYKNLNELAVSTVADSTRDFVYIDDLVRLLSHALMLKGQKGFYNVSSGHSISIKEVFEKIARIMNIDPIGKFKLVSNHSDDASKIQIDSQETSSKFNWKATTTIDQGLLSTIQSYYSQMPKSIFTHLKSY